jgi:hypothetical protein
VPGTPESEESPTFVEISRIFDASVASERRVAISTATPYHAACPLLYIALCCTLTSGPTHSRSARTDRHQQAADRLHDIDEQEANHSK